jgi:4-hydroxy-3-methylbut-2-enyl diphosphate reductase
VHQEAKRFAADGYRIMLIGHEGHEEVEGTAGEAPQVTTLVQTPEEAARISVAEGEKVVWLSQTTLSVDETLDTVDELRKVVPNLMNPPSDDICYATQNRQMAVKQMAPQCDLVIVVGSANSSNSVRLVEVALEAGARASYRVDGAEEIQSEWLAEAAVVGVTSGASVPEVLVHDVLAHLQANGYPQPEVVEAIEERVRFALPPNLRREIKAAAARVVD